MCGYLVERILLTRIQFEDPRLHSHLHRGFGSPYEYIAKGQGLSKTRVQTPPPSNPNPHNTHDAWTTNMNEENDSYKKYRVYS